MYAVLLQGPRSLSLFAAPHRCQSFSAKGLTSPSPWSVSGVTRIHAQANVVNEGGASRVTRNAEETHAPIVHHH
ncbi:hypothetical protein X777_10697 [Ooceraea biroi]|uniref:Uncharacterized protein n=1 Tax=Ooceraea biroi TaxID=2015173 RepID=A0A026W637_OOCBI|nr:hypothetical protein X777_10697 [Ooceraea biroi]